MSDDQIDDFSFKVEDEKKVKSEDWNEEKIDLEGFELEELQQIGNLSRGRKSQHTIPQDDIKDIKQFINKYSDKKKKSENTSEELNMEGG